MVKLRLPVSRDVVQKFKGLLDFYSQNGEHYVRRWPRYTARVQTPAEVLASCHLIHANAVYGCLTEYLREGYSYRTSRMYWTRRDYFMVHYFGTVDPYHDATYNHHPPQPSPCPGGGGHYFALLHASAFTTFPWLYYLDLWFDQPLDYFLAVRRSPVRFFTQVQTPRGQRCEMGRVGARAGQIEQNIALGQVGPGRYRHIFLTHPASADPGRWYGFIWARIPGSAHRALSLSPWFMWEVPLATPPPEAPAPAITFMFDDIGLPPLSGIPVVPAGDAPEPTCFNPSVF